MSTRDVAASAAVMTLKALTLVVVVVFFRTDRLLSWLNGAVNAVGAWADWAVYDDAGRKVAASVTEFHARATAVAEFIDRHGPADSWTAARWDEFENVVAHRTAVLAREIRGGRS